VAYDPKRARGRTTPKHVVDAAEPAPVDGLLDGRIEVPEWATEHDDAAIELPVPTLAAAPADLAPAPEAMTVEPEPAVEPEPTVEPEPAAEPEAVEPEPAARVAPVSTRRTAPPISEPPVAPVPDTPGSRWLFVAFMVAVLAAIVWQLRRRARR
jgi:hypothetical protein